MTAHPPDEDQPMVTADDLEAALAGIMAVLRPATGEDWSVAAGTLEWDCWHTAEHLGDCLLSYAAQLVVQPPGRYVEFMASAAEGAGPAEVLELVQAGGGFLVAVLRTAAPGARAFHPSGVTGPAGFAALGCVETLLHGQDIARGLGRELDPPRGVCGRVLAARFPKAAAELDRTDPWLALQWATGRAGIPGRPRSTEWR
jgi:uncharacterized protein (TIGR03083 family)